jgi:hypothetical protein
MGAAATGGGVATFTTSSLKAGTHTIRATYPGDSTVRGSYGTLPQVVQLYATTTALRSSRNPVPHGQPVTFTATVTGSGPVPPTGTVQFKSGANNIGTATLIGTTAKLTKTTLAIGTHPITAEYFGNGVSGKSTSPVVNEVVQ